MKRYLLALAAAFLLAGCADTGTLNTPPAEVEEQRDSTEEPPVADPPTVEREQPEREPERDRRWAEPEPEPVEDEPEVVEDGPEPVEDEPVSEPETEPVEYPDIAGRFTGMIRGFNEKGDDEHTKHWHGVDEIWLAGYLSESGPGEWEVSMDGTAYGAKVDAYTGYEGVCQSSPVEESVAYISCELSNSFMEISLAGDFYAGPSNEGAAHKSWYADEVDLPENLYEYIGGRPLSDYRGGVDSLFELQWKD